jgi:hypothetical protein
MKKLLTLISFFVAVNLSAQTAQNTFIKGSLNIRFDTRTELDGDKPKIGSQDIYSLDINTNNNIKFQGGIKYRPLINNMFSSQTSQIEFDIDTDIVNPNNPAQTKRVGKLTGVVPINGQNQYLYSEGNLFFNTFSMGSAKGFESKFKGICAGKPPAKKEGLLDIVQNRISITKSIGGKTVSLDVTKYDKMELVNHILAAGPVQVYGETTVNGVLFYDYNRSAWYLQDIMINYFHENKMMTDKVSGNIRWVTSKNGEGQYEFDIRINEPTATEASMFAGPADESAFFAVDNNLVSLTGTMSYKDTITNKVITSSSVKIDLVGNKLTKVQTVYLTKLLFISNLLPLNSD